MRRYAAESSRPTRLSNVFPYVLGTWEVYISKLELYPSAWGLMDGADDPAGGKSFEQLKWHASWGATAMACLNSVQIVQMSCPVGGKTLKLFVKSWKLFIQSWNASMGQLRRNLERHLFCCAPWCNLGISWNIMRSCPDVRCRCTTLRLLTGEKISRCAQSILLNEPNGYV